MRKLLLVYVAMLLTGGAWAQDGIAINGVTWAACNVGNSGTFVADPQDCGNYYTYKEAQKVCPAGWRTPTREEFESLARADSEWGLVSGVAGRWFGSGGGRIFLPASGYRSSIDGALNYSDRGYYWSSTRPRKTKALSDGLLFDSSEVHPMHANNRFNSYSVRCVRQ